MMDDLISRAAAIDAILGSFNAIRAIEELHAVDAVPVVRCRECKHRPEYDPPFSRSAQDLVFPDDVCPMKCGDNWYSKRIPNDFFCAAGEGG